MQLTAKNDLFKTKDNLENKTMVYQVSTRFLDHGFILKNHGLLLEKVE